MNKLKKKSRNKGKPKTSLFKLSNKRLNKLAKQGKLKKTLGKDKLVSFLKQKTTKINKREPVIVPEKIEPDIPLHEADYEYYTKPGRNYEFLTDSHDKNSSRNKRKRAVKDENFNMVEGHYAKKAKAIVQATPKKYLLPLKSKETGLIQQYIDEVSEIAEDMTENSDEKESKEIEIEQTSNISKLSLNEAKQQIANLSLSIIESDQQNVGKLKELLDFLSDKNVKTSVRVLALISIYEIFKDIIPGYVIRPLTEEETKQQMKKDTKQLFNYEQSLLSYYCKYLEALEVYAKGKYSAKEQVLEHKKLLRRTALTCLTGLLIYQPHFNYRTNIISVVMPFILHKDSKTNLIIFEAIKRIFREDKNGVVSLEIVRLIGRIIKSKNFHVNHKILDTFLSLKIKEVQNPEDAEQPKKDYSKRIFTSRKDKKRKKMLKYLEKELKEASAIDDNKMKIRMHTEIISLVFLTYFRILKCQVRSPLLPNVLQGLAKFAHLINVSYFDDIFNVMTSLVKNPDLSRSESLHCIQTALTLLIGQGTALNIDPQNFYLHLYKSLLQLSCSTKNWHTDIPSTITCLDLMLLKRRKQMSATRCLAFVKRLANVATHLPVSIAMPLIVIMKAIIQAHPQTMALLSLDEEVAAVYTPETENPDHCAAEGSTLFELHLLRSSYDSNMSKCASHLLNMNSTENSRFNFKFLSRPPMDLFDVDLFKLNNKMNIN